MLARRGNRVTGRAHRASRAGWVTLPAGQGWPRPGHAWGRTFIQWVEVDELMVLLGAQRKDRKHPAARRAARGSAVLGVRKAAPLARCEADLRFFRHEKKKNVCSCR